MSQRGSAHDGRQPRTERFGLTPGPVLAAGGPRASARGYDDDPRDAFAAELAAGYAAELAAGYAAELAAGYAAERGSRGGVSLSSPFPPRSSGPASDMGAPQPSQSTNYGGPNYGAPNYGVNRMRELEPARPAPPGSARERLDVHELLRREADVVRPPPDQRGVSDQYVVLDSFAKDSARSYPAVGIFAWNFMVQGSTGNGAVGVRDKIDRVTEVQIAPFALPVLPYVAYPIPTTNSAGLPIQPINTTPAGTNVPGGAAFPLRATNASTIVPPATNSVAPIFSQVACGGRLTVQLVEAGLQSFSSLAGTRYHFDLAARITPLAYSAGIGSASYALAWTATKSGNTDTIAGTATPTPTTVAPAPGLPYSAPLVAEPTPNWDTYLFTDPLMDVHGLTLAFRNPDAPIQFAPDVLYATSVIMVSPTYQTNNATNFPQGPPAVPAPVPPIPAPTLPGGATWNANPAGSFYLMFNYTAHGLLSGDQVVIAGFNSGNPSLDAYINRPQGHLVGTPVNQTPAPAIIPVAQGVAIPTADSFTIDPTPDVTNMLFQYWTPATTLVTNADGSPTNPPQYRPVIGANGAPVIVGIPTYWLPPQSVDVFVLKRRVRVPIRLRRAVDRPTNDIVSVH
jgi:hypothetical protein